MFKLLSLLAAGLRVQAAVISISQPPPVLSISSNLPSANAEALKAYQELTHKYNDALDGYMAVEAKYNEVLDTYSSALSIYNDALSSITIHEKHLGLQPRSALIPRQAQPSCPPPTRITITQAPPVVTVMAGDPSSIASSFSYASGVDSIVYQNSKEDRPTGNSPETTSIFFTHTASGPAIVGTDDPNDGTILYHFSGITSGPVATTVVGFPPADSPKPTATPPPPRHPNRPQQGNSTEMNNSLTETHNATVTITTYLSTVTITPSPPITASPVQPSVESLNKFEKRQTCSMIFAKIGDRWASWCNNWDGSRTLTYTSFETTIVLTNVIGAQPIPETVYNPATASGASSIQQTGTLTTSTEVVSFPVTTITAVHSSTPPAATPTCGEDSFIKINFDDLPTYNPKDENSTTVPPIFSPYAHFDWTIGYGYGPDPAVPFYPTSGKRLGMYQPQASFIPETTIEGRDQPGSFGAGRRAKNGIYWFNARYLSVGCNTTEPCTIAATGYRWHRPSEDPNTGYEQVAFVQHSEVASLCENKPCNMSRIVFDIEQFSGLSSLNLQAHTANETVGFYFDDFEGSWTNTTCAAGLTRQSSRKL